LGGLRQNVGFIPSACPFAKEELEALRIDVIGGLASGFTVIECSNGIREAANGISPTNEGHLVNGPVKLGEHYRVSMSFNCQIGAAETALHNDVTSIDIVHREPATGKELIANTRRRVVWLSEGSQ